MALMLLSLLLLLLLPTTSAATTFENATFQYSVLKPCTLSSVELSRLGPQDPLEACLLYDEQQQQQQPDSSDGPRDAAALITIIQVSPSGCNEQRDGAMIATKRMNADNAGKGVAIGFHEDHYIQFRFVAVIAGNSHNVSEGEYAGRHIWFLNILLETIQPQYILGTCSEMSALEPDCAQSHSTILMAQVGPPNYYTADTPYVFGFHINSDMYPRTAMQTLTFNANDAKNGRLENQPIKVVYRTKSEFFKSTCESAIRFAREAGFTDITEISFDPFADHDDNGVVNAFDEPFLNSIADQACPPDSDQAAHHPAIFVCSSVEQDQLLARWKHNGCRPVSLWISASVSGWAFDNPGAVPYIQGGAQWHLAFDYSDRYFDSGAALVAYTEMEFGYKGTHNLVAAYSSAVLFSQHISSHYRISNEPTVADDFASEEAYEIFRRDLAVLTTSTLFGPFALNGVRRNVGRGAAASQWLPTGDTNSSTSFRNKCISPSSQAEAATVIPTLAATDCDGGLFIKPALIRKEESLLTSKCALCPVDTFTSALNDDLKCNPCPGGSATDGQEGSTACIAHVLNLVAKPIQAMGYTFVGMVWCTGICLIRWIIKNRKHPTNRGAVFSIVICFGAMISSSSIIALIVAGAEDGEDTTSASNACVAIPILYTAGWVLEYASMGAKAYRMFRESREPPSSVSNLQMFGVIGAAFLCDMFIVIVWSTVKPLEYTRRVLGASIDADTGLINVQNVGQCMISGGVSTWAFAAPLLVLHVSLVIATIFLLRGVRDGLDPYNERRHVTIVSVLTFEILIVGVPMLVAVGDSAKGKLIVLSVIVFLNDMCVLLFNFLPKIYYVDLHAEDAAEDLASDASMQSKSETSLGAFADQNVGDNRTSCRVILEEDNRISESRDNGSSSGEFKKRGIRDTVESEDDLTPPCNEDNSEGGERAPIVA